MLADLESSQSSVQPVVADAGLTRDRHIAVVIPCFRVSKHIFEVLTAMPDYVWRIYVVDDCCPENTGDLVVRQTTDDRVRVLRNPLNQGVGGAVIAGYRAAVEDGASVVVKVDGDGQMDPQLIGQFVEPILLGEADYTKGNRFFDLDGISAMPSVRIFGNAVLSFMAKVSTGYWDVFDPTNGYTAMHAALVGELPLDKISKRYFFETDMLFRLNLARAAVVDVPMHAVYGEEVSNLRISRILGEFLCKHAANFFKRVFYNYYLRGMSLASLELPLGIVLFVFGLVFGGYHWYLSGQEGVPSSTGTVMLSALPILTGIQLLLAFFGEDIASVPRRARHSHNRRARKVTP